jgi:Uma2 family endonuclease
MGMPAQQQEWTAEMALALPDDGTRYEVLDGELVVMPAPSWRHQTVVELLQPRLRAYVREHRLGWAKHSPADIVFSPKRLVQPDLFVVPWREGGTPQAWSEVTSLLLAVEALSPSTARIDRHRKRLIYQSERVPEYWIIDTAARLVERWRPDDTRPEVLNDELVWTPNAAIAPFILPLQAFFDEVYE